MTLFAILWNGIVAAVIFLPFCTHEITSLREALRHDPWIGIFVIHPLVGVAVVYVVVAMWVNETRIDVTSSTLTIRRGPLPWRGRRVVLPASTILHVYVQQYASHDEDDPVPAQAFRVVARLTNGRDVLIGRGMSQYSDARALEQWIEKRLDLVDEPNAGHLGRR